MSIDTKLKELIINTLSPEQFEGITPSTEEIYLVEDDAEYATVEELASKQDKLTAGNGIDITNNKISNNNQFVITEDMFDLEYDDTKGVAPYNTSYGYTNITIHDNVGIEWVEGASYTFVLDTKVATSTYRNVRIRIGESGDWKPLMTRSGAIAPGSTYFIKAMNIPFQYSNKYQTTGALNSVEYNSTYSINYSFDNGQHTGGVGAYAITRYSLCMQKPDMTWEKITATNKNYTTTANKEVNKTGFLLNHIRYYGTTTNIANGALIPANVMYTKSASVDASYSFNCTTTPNWGIGKQVYLVGTIGDDGLFYLDENQWWSVELPTSNDGKLYIRIGLTYNATNATITFLDDRPIVYHDGTGIKQYIEHDSTKQDTLVSGTNIKTINGEDIIGSGDIEIKSAHDLDNVTISKNSNNELQAIALIDNDKTYLPTDFAKSDELNNPYSLLESKYSELEITNSSWLKSNKQWNSKEMYPSVWEKLHQPKYFAWKVDNYDDKYGVIGTKLATPQHNDIVYQLVAGEIDGVYYDVGAIRGYVWNTIETPDSEEIIAITIHDNTGTLSTVNVLNRDTNYDILLAKKRTEPFTKYDFVVNEENERFMLPLKTKTSFVIDEGEENGIKYRIWNDGYCEQEGVITGTGTQTVSLIKNYSDISWNFTYGHSYTALLADSRILLSSTKSTNSFQLIMGTTSLTIYWKASGYLASDQYTPQNLYYYVGDTVQNASLIDVAQVTSQLANKVDITNPVITAPYLKETYVNGDSGYNVWSNGYCEQWGIHGSSSKSITITLLKEYANMNYNIVATRRNNGYASYYDGYNITSTKTFTVNFYDTNGRSGFWKTSGYLAEGEY